MLKSRSHVFVFVIAVFALGLLACETTNLIAGSAQRRPTARRSGSSQSPTRNPSAPFVFMPLDQPRCSAGDNFVSLVNGNVLLDGFPAFGQQVIASSQPGGAPIDSTPVQADENGNFQVTFSCGGSACNGTYWLWLVDDASVQVSPYIEYIFDDQCRIGTVNFGN